MPMLSGVAVNSLGEVGLTIGVQANIHLGGGQTEFCPNGFSGGEGSSRNFPGSIFGGGGGSSRNFPDSIFCGVAEIRVFFR